ncbi:hypothetical protein, partial [Endozoicomonas sp.]|uniref:hypothetical protein n=1 Tax=Endozoicomonas sp. TaxID=1892382 RepID=UPI00383A0CA7
MVFPQGQLRIEILKLNLRNRRQQVERYYAYRFWLTVGIRPILPAFLSRCSAWLGSDPMLWFT